MRVDLKKVNNGICTQELKDYLDDLVDRLTVILEAIDDDNLTEYIMKLIKGEE